MTLNVDGYEVVAVDAPGHGESDELQLDVVETAALLGDTGPSDLIGYSMGGRITLELAVAPPNGSSGSYSSAPPPASRTMATCRGRAADEQRAEEVERDGVAAFLDRWLSLPIFTTLSPAAAGLEARRANTAAGLAASLRLAGTARSARCGPTSPRSMPVLIVAALSTTSSATSPRGWRG